MTGAPGLMRIGEVAKAVGVSVETLRRWEANGRIRFVRQGRQRMLPVADLAALLGSTGNRSARPPSSLNRMPGTVVSVARDDLVAKVEMTCGGFRIVSLMSREAADALGLEAGVEARAVVDASNVIVELSD